MSIAVPVLGAFFLYSGLGVRVKIPLDLDWLQKSQITCCTGSGDWCPINEHEQFREFSLLANQTPLCECLREVENRTPSSFWHSADLIQTDCLSGWGKILEFCNLVEWLLKVNVQLGFLHRGCARCYLCSLAEPLNTQAPSYTLH